MKTKALNHACKVRHSRRSIVEILFGATFILIGSSYLGQAEQINKSPIAQLAYRAHLQMMSIDAWGWLFIACGATAVLSGLTYRHVLGFTALMGISGWWGLEFIASWVSTGYDRAIIGALTWLLLVGLLLVIAGWPDPRPHDAAVAAFFAEQK